MPAMLRALLLLLCLSLPACLEFDAQEITLHYDVQKDQFDMLLVYRGVYSTAADPTQDLDQLERVQQDGEFAFWSNWPLKPDLTKASNLEQPFADHCDVENGGFFTTPKGELCAFQFVRVRDVKGFLKKLNTAIGLVIQTQVLDQPLGSDKHKLDDDTVDLLQDVVRGRLPMVQVQGGAIVVTVPCSEPDHFWMMGQLADDLLDQIGSELGGRLWRMQQPQPAGANEAGGHGGEAPDQTSPDTMITIARKQLQEAMVKAAETRLLFENPITLQRTEEQTVVTLGYTFKNENVLQKAHDGRYRPNLEPLLKAQKIAIETGVPDQELARRFEKFHGREAVLPAKLAELRQKK